MAEINFEEADLSKLKYIKIVYTGEDGDLHEIKTEPKFVRCGSMLLNAKCSGYFNINCPQNVSIKFAADDCLYVGQAVLEKFDKMGESVIFTITAPKTLDRQQNRNFYRISLDKGCVLVATDSEMHSSTFLAQVIDISAGGVSISNLETVFDNDVVSIDPLLYEQFHIILLLDSEKFLKLPARYVRQEKEKEVNKYAFEFINLKQRDVDVISKYITKEQIEQINNQKNIK